MQTKWLLAVGLMACSLFRFQSAPAQTFSDQIQQASQCVLNYTANTRSKTAISLIQTACNDLYNHVGLSASQSRQDYDNCLLQHLSGAQSDDAAMQIQSSCANLYSPF